MVGLAIVGFLLFHVANPDISLFDALNISVVLAVGGFDNIFGAEKLPFPISGGLYAYSVMMKIMSSVFLGIVFATLTEWLVSARLQIASRRPVAPQGGHTIVVGMGAIGQRIAEILIDWRQPTVGVSELALGADILPGMPLEIGPLREALARANAAGARSFIVATDDQVTNLEISLLARQLKSFRPHHLSHGGPAIGAQRRLAGFRFDRAQRLRHRGGSDHRRRFRREHHRRLSSRQSVGAGHRILRRAGRHIDRPNSGRNRLWLRRRADHPQARRGNALQSFRRHSSEPGNIYIVVVLSATVAGRTRRDEVGERAAPKWRLCIDVPRLRRTPPSKPPTQSPGYPDATSRWRAPLCPNCRRDWKRRSISSRDCGWRANYENFWSPRVLNLRTGNRLGAIPRPFRRRWRIQKIRAPISVPDSRRRTTASTMGSADIWGR